MLKTKKATKQKPLRREKVWKKSTEKNFGIVFFSYSLWSLKCTLFHRREALRGVGRGVTEPDTKQKLGQVRGARRGRQERACGMEPCVGTKLTRPPPPQLQSDLLTHTFSSILTPLDFLSIVFITLCPHCKLHAESENESSACVLLKKWRIRMWRSTPPWFLPFPFHTKDNLK